MEFLEKDLEEIIFNSFKEDGGLYLEEKGILMEGKVFRQLKIGNYGVCDLLTVKRDHDFCDGFNGFIPVLNFTIYELKKDKIGISALLQSMRYLRGVQRYIKINKPKLFRYCNFNIALIGRNIDDTGSFCYSPSLFENIKMYVYSYGIDGLSFEETDGSYLVDEGFKSI